MLALKEGRKKLFHSKPNVKLDWHFKFAVWKYRQVWSNIKDSRWMESSGNQQKNTCACICILYMQEKANTWEFSLPLAINVLSKPPKQDRITYLFWLWPVYLNGFSHFPATSHMWISWLFKLTMKFLQSTETDRDVIGCSSEMTLSAYVPKFSIRISLSDKTLIRFSPSGVTARSKTLGILVPLHAFISFPSQSHMKMPFSVSELPQTSRFESGNQAHELTMKPWSPNVCLQIPVSTSHSLRTSAFPHVSNFVSSGLHATKETGFWWLRRVCFNVSLLSSST